VVLRDGFLQQIDTPQKLYDRPANLFVAEFIGSPAMNLVGAQLERANGSVRARFGDHELPLDDAVSSRPALREFLGRKVILGIRPEDLEDAEIESGAPADHRLRAVVDIREDMGSEVFVHFAVAAPAVLGADVAAAMGEDVVQSASAQAGGRSVFTARIDRDSRAAEGQPIELVVNTRRLHFFDPETSHGIYDPA
jgi:multiple sugar transport system ATP-binding protein